MSPVRQAFNLIPQMINLSVFGFENRGVASAAFSFSFFLKFSISLLVQLLEDQFQWHALEVAAGSSMALLWSCHYICSD